MAAAAEARQFASPALKTLAQRRLAELTGLVLALAGLTLLVALGSYDPRDPSWDTATAESARNLAGLPGAWTADLLVQWFGFAGALPGFALLAWSWRIGAHRGLTSVRLRLVALLLGVPVLSTAFAGLPVLLGHALSWPLGLGPGGAVGRLTGAAGLEAGAALFGQPAGGIVVWTLLAVLGLTLTVLALGLSRGEWGAAGQVVGSGLRRGRRAAGFCGRVAAGLGGAGVALLERLNGSRADDAPAGIYPGGRAEPRVVPPRAAGSEPVAGASPPGTARVVQTVRKPAAAQQEVLPLEGGPWRFPSLSLLRAPPARPPDAATPEALQANARLLESVLSDYGVHGQIVAIHPGPVVTLYELEPAPGIRSARVIGLADDVARSLSVAAVRIATVAGRNVIGIEVPNARRETVFLSEILGAEDWAKQSGRLLIALGKDIGGDPVIADLARMPHLLVAGTTGSGKSVAINAMILSLLFRMSPDQCRLIMIDPKMLELSSYDGIPHLLAPVVTEPAKAVNTLKWAVREMERRYRSMSQLSVRNVAGYNDRVEQARAKGEVVTRRVQTGVDRETGRPTFEEQPLALEPLPYIVVVIDEMADLMMVAGKEIEAAVQRLAQMARAAGIHVIMATQRPSVDVITGVIKANFPTRISFQVISKFDSRTILGEQGAEQLLGQGDMLYMAGGGRITRVHGPFVTDPEVDRVVAFLREQGEPAYVEEVTDPPEDAEGSAMAGIAGASDGEKGLFDQAVDLVSREGKASTSFIQRHLQIGYNRAARLIEQMEKEGIVGPANHVGKREVLTRRTRDEE
jgi:S-DNA-T family DNA segregation ATPase FtsK/SpoIIIE